MDKLKFISSHKFIIGSLLVAYNRLNLHNRLRNRGNKLECKLSLLNNVKIKIKGKGNSITIDELSRIHDTLIYISGNNNVIVIGKKCYTRNLKLHIEDDSNMISIGDNTSVCGKTHLAAIESTRLIIGKDCMFSSDIRIVTGDSHSVVDMQGERINPSKDVVIGNHNWIGAKVTCLKGVCTADNCIIGASSTVTKKFDNPNCAIAGVPAKIVSTDLNWLAKRI